MGIDLLAGPTEVLVIADATADPELVAADLLGQAEHGPTSPAGCIAIGDDTAKNVARAVHKLLRTWPTADVTGQAWHNHGWIAIGGLWVGKFLETCTYQRMSAEGRRRVAPAAAAISHAEHFEGHALTAEIRLRQLEDTTS